MAAGERAAPVLNVQSLALTDLVGDLLREEQIQGVHQVLYGLHHSKKCDGIKDNYVINISLYLCAIMINTHL